MLTTNLAEEVLDAIRKPVLVLDCKMIVQSANAAYYRMFRTTASEVLNHCFYDLDDGHWDSPLLRNMLEHVWIRQTTPEDVEVESNFPRIGLKTMLMYACRLVHQGDTAKLMVLACEDITARRTAEEQIQAYVLKLESSNRELQDFAYIASHDLQEPLRSIQSFSERLKKCVGDDLSEEGRDAVQRIERAAARMRCLISDLLEFSQITTKAKPFTAVNLNDVVMQAWGDLSKRVEETGGRIQLAALPTVEADFTQMRQLFQNLIGNALKYGRPGVAPIVMLHCEIQRGSIDGSSKRLRDICSIKVSDNGMGFEERYAQRIFAPFQRLHGRGRYDGTGIGLAICRKITERHGGRITAKGTPNEGAVFTILVPLKQNCA